MTDETKEIEETGAKTSLAGIAQVIVGEIESLGGVILGDPTTSAEGDFNVQVGTLHQDASDALNDTENTQNAARHASNDFSREGE